MSLTPELIARLESLLARAEALLPAPPAPADWSAISYRWRRRPGIAGGHGFLDPVKHVARIALDDIRHVDRQKEAIVRNTRQFVAGAPANNVLLTGARGTGKSS